MKTLYKMNRKHKLTKEDYLLSVIERMLYNGGLIMLDKVNDIPGFKLKLSDKATGPVLEVKEVLDY